MIVFNKLLKGWFVVRGKHHSPLHGPYASKKEAREAILHRQQMRDSVRKWGKQ